MLRRGTQTEMKNTKEASGMDVDYAFSAACAELEVGTERQPVPGGRGSLPPLSNSASPVPTEAPSPCEVLSKYLWNG